MKILLLVLNMMENYHSASNNQKYFFVNINYSYVTRNPHLVHIYLLASTWAGIVHQQLSIQCKTLPTVKYKLKQKT